MQFTLQDRAATAGQAFGLQLWCGLILNKYRISNSAARVKKAITKQRISVQPSQDIMLVWVDSQKVASFYHPLDHPSKRALSLSAASEDQYLVHNTHLMQRQPAPTIWVSWKYHPFGHVIH